MTERKRVRHRRRELLRVGRKPRHPWAQPPPAHHKLEKEVMGWTTEFVCFKPKHTEATERDPPFQVEPHYQSLCIPFHLHRGEGAPKCDLGHLGDAYIDLLVDRLYGKLSKGWMRWRGPPNPHLHTPVSASKAALSTELSLRCYDNRDLVHAPDMGLVNGDFRSSDDEEGNTSDEQCEASDEGSDSNLEGGGSDDEEGIDSHDEAGSGGEDDGNTSGEGSDSGEDDNGSGGEGGGADEEDGDGDEEDDCSDEEGEEAAGQSDEEEQGSNASSRGEQEEEEDDDDVKPMSQALLKRDETDGQYEQEPPSGNKVEDGGDDSEEPRFQGHKVLSDVGEGANRGDEGEAPSREDGSLSKERTINDDDEKTNTDIPVDVVGEHPGNNGPARKKQKVGTSGASSERLGMVSPSDALTAMSQRVEHLLSDLRESHSSFVEVLKQNHDLQQRVDALDADLEDARNTAAEQSTQNSHLRERVAELEGNLTTARASALDYQCKIQDQGRVMEECQKRCAELESAQQQILKIIGVSESR